MLPNAILSLLTSTSKLWRENKLFSLGYKVYIAKSLLNGVFALREGLFERPLSVDGDKSFGPVRRLDGSVTNYERHLAGWWRTKLISV